MRLWWLIGSLVIALGVGVLTLQVPRPAPATAPATAFSSDRAMIDIRAIAREPHPVGSAEHARVQAYLTQRMAALGLQTSTQTGPLSPGAIRRLERAGGDPAAADYSVTNLVGVLPGRDPTLPAVALMAHYDTTVNSPGAADDSTGVAAVLEAVRAIRARGPADRTLVVLLTDGEELDLDGARVFWGGHPLRDRIGAVVNLEARGGGGRAMMFETGIGNAETVALFADSAPRIGGGVTSNALAVFVYRQMPNGTDFTIPARRGVQGLNFAFIGRPEQYHAASSTPDQLDQGSVQHIGAQALESADALLRAPALPAAGRDVVFADLFGRIIIHYPPETGWILWGLGAGLLGVACALARRRMGLTAAEVGRGMVDGLWFLSAGWVVLHVVRALGGPMAGRIDSADAYYTLLARLPWLEAGAAFAVLAMILAVLGGRARPDRRVSAGALAVLTLASVPLAGLNWPVLIAGGVAAGLSLAPQLAARTLWGGWTGLIALLLVLAAGAQAAAPGTAFLLLWPALLAAGAAVVAALHDPAFLKPTGPLPVALAAALAGGWLVGLAHPVFLGIGMDLPGVLAILGLPGLMLVRPLGPDGAARRPVLMIALAVLLLGAGLSGAAGLAGPMIAAATP
ncbi:M20/M25/M40 family metallo-hydrolase [Brevundimonas sp. FT23042]|uniref:M20/M25/M40 family metallo-hydrolase n=1 Tax=Brevundimonas sp. FT23042 TaxID=3393749 RepID=UPI003B58B244